jgi:hypothetical protein
MTQIPFNDIAYICSWAFLGSILCFFSFMYVAKSSLISKIKRCLLSIYIGLFLSLPLYEYLQWLNKFPKSLNIMLCGIGAFGLPDFILSHWSKLVQAFVFKAVDKITDDNKNKKS